MEIKELKNRKAFDTEKIRNCYNQFVALVELLKKRALSEKSSSYINVEIDTLNNIRVSDKTLRKQVRKSQARIVQFLAKEEKIVTKNYYRNLWMALGMSAYGIPMGAAFGAALDNMGLLGVGIPLGMAFGIALGTKKDNEAANKGNQLAIDLKHY